jgi:dTDP-4-amino-4,6-dideoxygalactose transaminase
MRVEFYKHNLDETDIANVTQALKGLFLTTGEWVERFERDLAAYEGRAFAVGVTSATGGLHIALAALGIGPGDEVITTPMSFVATANAIVMTGAKPVFVDVEETTGNIDASIIDASITPRTRAVLPVHLYGAMCDMRMIDAAARRRGLVVVEDAAHALEARRDGLRPGQLSDAAVLSFYATKSITSGEGGAVVTDNATLAARLKTARLHGISRGAAERYGKGYAHADMTEFGWKYNMSNIQAALLLGQLPRVEAMRARREEISAMYERAFAGTPGISMPSVPAGATSGRHLFTIWVDPSRRDAILADLEARGVGVAVNYRPIHLMKYYRDHYGFREGMFPHAERIGASTITLPLYPKLTYAEIEYVIESVKAAVAGS